MIPSNAELEKAVDIISKFTIYSGRITEKQQLAVQVLLDLASAKLKGEIGPYASEEEIESLINKYIPLGNYKYRKALAHALSVHGVHNANE